MEQRRDTINGRYGRAAAVTLAAAAAAIVMTWPLARDPGHLGRTANSGDARFSVWNVAWVAHALLTDPLDVFDANIYYPHRDTLAYSEANIGAGLVATPVWWLTRNANASHNAVVLFSFAASVITMWLLARRLTGDGPAAATSAVLFAFCPFLFSHTAHIQLLMAAGLPLAMLMFHRLADAPSLRAGVMLGLALAAQALSCAYYGIFAGFLVGYAALFVASSRGLWRSRAFWLSIGAGAVVSIGLVLPFFIPYIRLQHETGFGRSLADAVPYSAYFRSYLASAAHAHNWLLPIIRDWNHEVLFPGFLSAGLGALGMAALLRAPRSDPGAPRSRDRETLTLYASLGVLAFWASLGPRAGLYSLLFKVVPVFSLLRAPGRTGIVVSFVLALFAGFGVRYLRARVARGAAVVAAACCAAALVELNGVPIDWRPARPISPAYDVLAGMPRGAVAEFPFYERRIDFHVHTIYMVSSTLHWQPLLNGYSDYIPPDFRELAVTLASFPSRESFLALKKRRARYIVLHRDLYGIETAPLIEARLQPYMPYLKPVASDEQTLIYEITGWPE